FFVAPFPEVFGK
nr:inhibitor,angiotensin converting enzyme [Bos taurus]